MDGRPQMACRDTGMIQPLSAVRWTLLVCLITAIANWAGAEEPTTPKSQAANSSGQLTAVFQGSVLDSGAPVAGARVRIQTSGQFTTTDSSGQFTLNGEGGADGAVLTAWAPGYFIGGGHEHHPDERHVEITLERHGAKDHHDYVWVSAFTAAGEENNCQNCHEEPENPASQLTFDQWRRDAHAGSARNVRFLSMYLGTDIHGNRSPPTRYRQDRDYGRTPIRPRIDQTYFGPGHKLDFPTTAGNCATCHVPLAALDNPYGIDPSQITGIATEGINCDFCHKIWDVVLDPASGLPFGNRPGTLSFEFRRPSSERQFFAGPLDDAAPGDDVYAPIYAESRFCAPCHFAEFWDVEIYGSFGEWLRSAYAQPESVTTCQDCHMPTGLNDHFVRFDKGGHRRDPDTIFSHRMPGAADEDLLRQAVTMTATARLSSTGVEIQVDIANDKTGHHVPTDSPLRQMILVVRATNEAGVTLTQRRGPTLPTWCGVGDPDEGYLSGFPGTAYAKILEEIWTGVSPTGAYWNPTRIVSDNRIPAHRTDTTFYTFEPPAEGNVTADVRLLYRRAFIQLRDWKSWDGTDIEMARQTLVVARETDQALIPPEPASGR